VGISRDIADTVVIEMVKAVKYKLYNCEVHELEPLDLITEDYIKCIHNTVRNLIEVFEALKKQLDELGENP